MLYHNLYVLYSRKRDLPYHDFGKRKLLLAKICIDGSIWQWTKCYVFTKFTNFSSSQTFFLCGINILPINLTQHYKKIPSVNDFEEKGECPMP